MGVVVIFDPAAWRLAYPQFAFLTDEQLTGSVLPVAEVYLRNDGTGPVQKQETQKTLLWLIVAHVAQLMFGRVTDGVNGPQPVGRISNASEGSVSVQFEFPTTSPGAAWFNQTPYGAAFWAASAAYRTMRYIPGFPSSSRRLF